MADDRHAALRRTGGRESAARLDDGVLVGLGAAADGGDAAWLGLGFGLGLRLGSGSGLGLGLRLGLGLGLG